MRIVMFVFNDTRTDSRVLREAGSLAKSGHEVTIVGRPADPAAVTDDREIVGGFEVIRIAVPQTWRHVWTWLRYPWRLRRWWVDRIALGLRHPVIGWLDALMLVVAAVVTLPWALIQLPFFALTRRRSTVAGSTIDWLVRWRFMVLGWAARAASAAPVADAYHGHDLSGLEAAGRAAQRYGGVLVYDSHEIFLESRTNARRPRWLKALLGRSERDWTRSAAALVTVNRSLALELGRRLRPARTIVVHNAPQRWDSPRARPDLIRAATGIPVSDRIAMYHGAFSADRGLEQLAAALLEPEMQRVHAVFLGFGSRRSMLLAMASDPRYGGRLHVLDAVAPEELQPWVASADVEVVAIQPTTLNHRLSTPNKLFESLASGVPVVVSDFPEMRQIVLGDPDGPLGAVCHPDEPVDVARAIASIVALPAEERDELRARCLAAAHARWNWETEVQGLLDLYCELGGGEPDGNPTKAA